MPFIWSSVRKDLQRRARDPWVFLVWIGIPLFVGILLTLIMGGSGGAQPRAHLLLVDEDQSLVSSLVGNIFSQGQFGELIDLEELDRSLADEKMADGGASALLVIPSGFGDAVLNEEETTLLFLTNPSQQILPSIVREGVSLIVDAGFYLHRVFGEEVELVVGAINTSQVAGPDFSDIEISELSIALNEKIQGIAETIFPPLIGVNISAEEADAPPVSFALIFFPGFLLMALVFSSQGLSEDFWKERDLGTSHRLVATPQKPLTALYSKIIVSMLVYAAICVILLVIGFAYHEVPWEKFPVSLTWLIVAGVAFFGLMSLVQISAPTHKAGTLITSIAMFPILMIGGSFFPIEAMPGWMGAIGKWTPNGLVLEQIKNYLLDRSDLASMLGSFAILVAITSGIILLLGIRHRAFVRSE